MPSIRSVAIARFSLLSEPPRSDSRLSLEKNRTRSATLQRHAVGVGRLPVEKEPANPLTGRDRDEIVGRAVPEGAACAGATREGVMMRQATRALGASFAAAIGLAVLVPAAAGTSGNETF